MEIAFDTDLGLDPDDYSPTISVGTIDAAPSDFTVIENVSDLWAEFLQQLTSAIAYLIMYYLNWKLLQPDDTSVTVTIDSHGIVVPLLSSSIYLGGQVAVDMIVDIPCKYFIW